jgi:hypothetical protein
MTTEQEPAPRRARGIATGVVISFAVVAVVAVVIALAVATLMASLHPLFEGFSGLGAYG